MKLLEMSTTLLEMWKMLFETLRTLLVMSMMLLETYLK